MDDSKSKTETKQEETENIETVLMPVAGLFNNIKGRFPNGNKADPSSIYGRTQM